MLGTYRARRATDVKKPGGRCGPPGLLRPARREAFVEAALAAFPPFTFDLLAARAHARLWAQLAAAGAEVGAAHDRLVAATAIAAGWRVPTAIIRHFERIPGLDVVVIALTE